MRVSCEGAEELILSEQPSLLADARQTPVGEVVVVDGGGQWVCAKRLEKGRFGWPCATADQPSVVLSHEELGLLLNGMDLERVSRRRWYRKVAV